MKPTPEPGWTHLNNGGINRPSLLSGSGTRDAGAASSGRILADMEGRTPQATARLGNPVLKHGRSLLVVAAIVAALVAIALLIAFARHGHDGAFDTYSQAPENPAPAAVPSPVASDDGAALIVDAGGTTDSRAAAASAMAVPTDAASASAGGASAAAPHIAANATAAGTASADKARTQRVQSRTVQKKNPDDDLLGTLLGIIKKEEKKAPQHESMDSLINRIRAEDQRNTANANAAFDSIDKSKAKPRASTHSEIQVQLRRCPNANTLKGIECRRKICAAHSGEDPACPAP
ncbi:MAG: hypothetical protein QM581_14540 [Pseudomonas sp.]